MSVTCVIPTHRRPELLREAIESVASQDLPEGLQIVIVDDTGDPVSAAIVEAARALHPEHRFDYLDRSEGMTGASASRNAGAAVAIHPRIAFLDDDDLWSPRFLSTALAAMGASAAPLAVTWIDALRPGQDARAEMRMPPGLRARDVVARNPGITGSNFVVDATAFGAVGGFDPDLPVSNDKDFFVRFLAAGYGYAVVEQPLVLYRHHAGPQLTKPSAMRLAGQERYLAKHAGMLSPGDRRHLRRQIHATSRRLAPTTRERIGHLLAMAALSSPRDLVDAVRRRL